MDNDDAAPTRPRKLVALHWLTVLCVSLAAIFILTRDELDGRALRQWLLEGHRHAGLLVLLLFAVRVALRIRYGKLPPGGEHSRLVRVLAGLTHIALAVDRQGAERLHQHAPDRVHKKGALG